MASALRTTGLRAFTQARTQVQRTSLRAVRQFTSSQRVWQKYYTEEHEWVELSADKKIGTVGITTYAAKQLGDVVYVELPSVDAEVGKGDTMGAVESVKSASDILSPISGKIVEVNEVLDNAAGTINQSPEDGGWIAKIEVSDASELESLMDAKTYEDFTEKADADH